MHACNQNSVIKVERGGVYDICIFAILGVLNMPLYFQALVYEHPGQELEIELFDEDPDKDDFLGR